MAQADSSVVNQLRKAITNIYQFPRGFRRFSDMSLRLDPSMTSSFSAIKQTKELFKPLAEQFDQHIFNMANNYFDKEAPFQLDEVFLSGSISEGTLKCDFEKKIVSDTDFMLVLKNIEVTEEDQKRENLSMKENTPFVTLYLTDEDLKKTWADFVELSSEPYGENKLILSSLKLKEKFSENYLTYGPFLMEFAEEKVNRVDEGPSLVVSSSLPGNGPFPDVSKNTSYFDFVLAIKCEGWPHSAQEWPARSRCWPTQDIVQKIIKNGFHIVGKSSPQGNFRLSFSNAETILIENLTDLQHKVYRAFKSFVNHYKNEWSPNIKKSVCSYHLKTIVLWYCEKTGPKGWTEDSVVSHLLSLIDELIMALRKRNLPMYFMPNYNLLEQVEDGHDIAQKITKLRWSTGQISDAIISEEPDINSAFNVLKIEAEKFCEMCQKCVAKGKFEPSDFMEYIDNRLSCLDEVFMNAVGRLPSRDNEAFKRTMSSVNDPMMKFLTDVSEMLNIF